MTKAKMSKKNNMDDWIIECNKDSNLDKENYTEILFLGDVALAGQVGDVIQRHGSQFLFNEIPPDFFNADILCYNLECCLSTRGEVWEPKPIPFRGLPEFLSVFPKTGCNYVANVANNHFLDYGENAALDTLEALRAYGMQHFGATGSAVERQHIVLKTHAGDVGLIGFAPSVHPLAGARQVNLTTECVSDMASHVDSLKQQSDIVIVSLHQGVEHTQCVDRHCRKITHCLVDAGADCIVCHHPHIIQGIEAYNGVHIFHSIGSFVIGLDFRRRPSARNSLALRLMLCKGKLHRIIVEPFVIVNSLQPRPATREEKQQIRIETEDLSYTFDSKSRLSTDYLRCGAIRRYGQVCSLYEMVQQQGILSTTKYYLGRIMARGKRRDPCA